MSFYSDNIMYMYMYVSFYYYCNYVIIMYILVEKCNISIKWYIYLKYIVWKKYIVKWLKIFVKFYGV